MPSRAVIVLGATSSGIVAGATRIDIGAGVRPGLLTFALTGEQIPDSGEVGVDDVARRIFRALGSTTTTVNLVEGGTATVASDAEQFLFTRHALTLPPGALTGETIDITLGTVPPGVTQSLGLPTAMWVTTNRGGPINFARPVTLTVEFGSFTLEDELLDLAGRFQLAQLVEIAPGVFEPIPFSPNAVTLDRVNRTLSVKINSLNPLGGVISAAAAPGRRGAVGENAGIFVTLPVNPVEERSGFIAPSVTGAAAQPAGATTAQISPGPSGAYTQHLLSFPGYQSTTESDPNRIGVTVRAPSIFERISTSGGQSFPTPSASLFTVETRNAGGSLIPFTDPVDLQVQFIEMGGVDANDVVRFDESVDVPQRMRIVQDIVSGTDVDFNFAAGAQSVSVGAGTVTLTGLASLTNADGKATIGSVANPGVMVPAELSLEGSPSVAEVTFGEEFTQTFEVTNAGAESAGNVELTVEVDPDLTIGVVNTDQGSASTAGSTVTVTIGAMGAGQTVTVSVAATLDTLPPDSSPMVTTASVTGTNLDPEGLGDDQDSLELPVILPPDIEVVATIDLGEVAIGAGPGTEFRFAVENPGVGSLLITAAPVAGAHAGDFQRTEPVSGTLSIAAGASAEIGVMFEPTALGIRQATLTIESNDPDEPMRMVTLQGTGVEGEPMVILTQDIVDYLIGTLTPLPPTPEDLFDVNMDARVDSADVVRNVNEEETP